MLNINAYIHIYIQPFVVFVSESQSPATETNLKKKRKKDSLKKAAPWNLAVPGAGSPTMGQVGQLYYMNGRGRGPQTPSDRDGQMTEHMSGCHECPQEGCLVVQSLTDSSPNTSPASSYQEKLLQLNTL